MNLHAHVVQNTASSTIALAESDTDAEYHRHEILGFSVLMAAEVASDEHELAHVSHAGLLLGSYWYYPHNIRDLYNHDRSAYYLNGDA